MDLLMMTIILRKIPLGWTLHFNASVAQMQGNPDMDEVTTAAPRRLFNQFPWEGLQDIIS